MLKLHPLRAYEFTMPQCTFSVPVEELRGDAVVRSLARLDENGPQWIMQPVDVATMDRAMEDRNNDGVPVMYCASDGRLHIWPSPAKATRFRIDIATVTG